MSVAANEDLFTINSSPLNKRKYARVFCINLIFITLLVPEDYFLLGCVFAIADYPEQMSDKQLLATWKRVIICSVCEYFLVFCISFSVS